MGPPGRPGRELPIGISRQLLLVQLDPQPRSIGSVDIAVHYFEGLDGDLSPELIEAYEYSVIRKFGMARDTCKVAASPTVVLL